MARHGEGGALTVQTDAVAALFERRWRQECDTGLLLADENRRLQALVRQQQVAIERLQMKLEGRDDDVAT